MKARRIVSFIILCAVIPCVVVGGALIFKNGAYAWVSLCVAALACAPVFLRFERRETDVKRLLIIAAMTALSVVGRIVFAPIPAFKPVTAFVIICAMYFGPEAGFLTGALSAVVSDFYFGQGPWTPFQMFAWGMIGLVAGLFAGALKRSKVALAVGGALAGVAFSLLMDVWTVLWADGYFNVARYGAALVSALPFTAVYAVSNVVFLLALSTPISRILTRIITKYGL